MSLLLNALLSRRVLHYARASVAALTLLHGAAYAQEAPMTLEGALQSAADKSAAMQAAQASEQASSEVAVRAGQLPDPVLKIGIDNLPVDGPQRFTVGQDFMTMRRVGIEQEWVSGDKRRLRSALAGQVVVREHDDYLAQLSTVRERTALAWLDAHYAQSAAVLQRELVGHMQHELAATQASYKGAKASATEVAQAQAMLAQTQDQLLKAEQTYQTALIGLSRWTVAPVSDVIGDPPEADSTVANLPPDALRRVHPALLAASDDIAIADADTAVATSERSPNWTWEVSYQQRGGQFSNMVSVGVNIPLPLNRRDRQDRTVSEKGQLATKARLMLEDDERQVTANLRALAVALDSGRKRIANLTQSLLPAADLKVQLATAAYRSGTGSLADTFAARRAQIDAELQVLELRRSVSDTWAQLEYQVVPPTMGALQ